MKREVFIKFKDGSEMLAEPKIYDFGLLDLGNGISLNANSGRVYKHKGNVICGEDISNTIDTIKTTIQY